MMRAPDVRVWIPLDEIFQNLPPEHHVQIGAALELEPSNAAPEPSNAEPADKPQE